MWIFDVYFDAGPNLETHYQLLVNLRTSKLVWNSERVSVPGLSVLITQLTQA